MAMEVASATASEDGRDSNASARSRARRRAEQGAEERGKEKEVGKNQEGRGGGDANQRGKGDEQSMVTAVTLTRRA